MSAEEGGSQDYETYRNSDPVGAFDRFFLPGLFFLGFLVLDRLWWRQHHLTSLGIDAGTLGRSDSDTRSNPCAGTLDSMPIV